MTGTLITNHDEEHSSIRTPAEAIFEAEIPVDEQRDVLARFGKDLRDAARTLTPSQMRWLVDMYYAMQRNRIAAANQQRSQGEADEPNGVVTYLAGVFATLETQIKTAMRYYAERRIVGQWSLLVPGIGPVIAAGLIAHVDVKKSPSAGHIWRYAGLDPTVRWLGQAGARALVEEVLGPPVRGAVISEENLALLAARSHRDLVWLHAQASADDAQVTRAGLVAALSKRPWNARMKVLSYFIGESFVKVQNRDKDFYGKIYAARKVYEQENNAKNLYADQAARILQEKRIGTETIAYSFYSKGQLPPAQIHARARRYATKLFLAHWQYVAWSYETGQPPARPYSIEHLGHVDEIKPPFWPLDD